MNEMGLRPDRGYVKCARVVGDVMGRLHPHGDAAIYDALVRMAQPWVMRLPLVDGHGNFGSLGGDDAPAAYRYTEARLTAAAMEMVASIDEDTVEFQPNYDGSEIQPEVLPAGLPNLLVNGASGIAVGMATNMAPHNLGEVIAAARYLIDHPGHQPGRADAVRSRPRPAHRRQDRRPGRHQGGVRDRARHLPHPRRRQGREDHPAAHRNRDHRAALQRRPGKGHRPDQGPGRREKLAGIADGRDTPPTSCAGCIWSSKSAPGSTPRRCSTSCTGSLPWRRRSASTTSHSSTSRPRLLGLRELLQIYVDHRIEVVRRRSEYRRRKRADRLHLVDGLMIALLNIDEVIQVIRQSDDASSAKERLMSVFDLSEIQAQYILDTPLRRLTRYDRLELERERDQLQAEIDELTAILDSESRLREVVSGELASVAKRFAKPRRTGAAEGTGAPPHRDRAAGGR